MKKLCDGKCNQCKLINSSNMKQLNLVLTLLENKFGDEVTRIINDHCANMTVCFDCRVDDFYHLDYCETNKQIEKYKVKN